MAKRFLSLLLFLPSLLLAGLSVDLDSNFSSSGWDGGGIGVTIGQGTNAEFSLNGSVYKSGSSLAKNFSLGYYREFANAWNFDAGVGFIPELDNYSQQHLSFALARVIGTVWQVEPSFELGILRHSTSIFSGRRNRTFTVLLNQTSFSPGFTLSKGTETRIRLSGSLNRYTVNTPNGRTSISDLKSEYDTTALILLVTSLRLARFDSLFVEKTWSISFSQELFGFMVVDLSASGNGYLFPVNGKEVYDFDYSGGLIFYPLDWLSVGGSASYYHNNLGTESWSFGASLGFSF